MDILAYSSNLYTFWLFSWCCLTFHIVFMLADWKQIWNLSNDLHQWGPWKFQFYPKKNRDIFGKLSGILDVLLICFNQIVSIFENIYSNTKSLQLICEKFSLNTAIFTEPVIFRVVSRTIYPSPEIFTLVPFVAFVTNSMPDWKADPRLYKNQWVMVSLNTLF